MQSRPRTPFVKKLIGRRCPKCGVMVNDQRTRCKRCAKVLTRPKKAKKNKSKFRYKKAKVRAKQGRR